MAGRLIRKKKAFGVAAVALSVLLLLAINISSNTALRGFRVDLTEDKLFTLSFNLLHMCSSTVPEQNIIL